MPRHLFDLQKREKKCVTRRGFNCKTRRRVESEGTCDDDILSLEWNRTPPDLTFGFELVLQE